MCILVPISSPRRQISFVHGFARQPRRRLELWADSTLQNIPFTGTIRTIAKWTRRSQLATSRAFDFVLTLTVLSPPLWRRSNESKKCFGEVTLVCEAYACGHLGDREIRYFKHLLGSLNTCLKDVSIRRHTGGVTKCPGELGLREFCNLRDFSEANIFSVMCLHVLRRPPELPACQPSQARPAAPTAHP